MEQTIVTPEIEYHINRRKDLETQRQKIFETYQAIYGAIQECDFAIKALTQMQLDKAKSDDAQPEKAPENAENPT